MSYLRYDAILHSDSEYNSAEETYDPDQLLEVVLALCENMQGDSIRRDSTSCKSTVTQNLDGTVVTYPCSNKTRSKSGYCHHHDPSVNICGFVRENGEQCQRKCEEGKLCFQHRENAVVSNEKKTRRKQQSSGRSKGSKGSKGSKDKRVDDVTHENVCGHTTASGSKCTRKTNGGKCFQHSGNVSTSNTRIVNKPKRKTAQQPMTASTKSRSSSSRSGTGTKSRTTTTTSSAKKYTCGAKCKNGSKCSRSVDRRGGRCHQHS